MKKILISVFTVFILASLMIYNIKSQNLYISDLSNLERNTNYSLNSDSINKFCDTIKILELKDDSIYKTDKYKVIYGILCENKKNNKSGIYILKNDSIISSIQIPDDNEVMNFELSKIEQIKGGFKIFTNAHNDVYYLIRNFVFQFINNEFMFVDVESKNNVFDTWSYRSFKIEKPIELENFSIEDYYIW